MEPSEKMSTAVSTLRNRFFKQLLCTAIAAAATRLPATLPFGSGFCIFHLIGPTCVSSIRAEKVATFSTSSPSSSYSSLEETSAGDSYTSPYLSVQIRCRKHVADMLSEALLCFGASSASIDELDNNEIDDEICISSIFDVGLDVNESISLAVNSIGLKEISGYDVVRHDHTDWIKQSQECFNPVEVTKGLWIVPEWRNSPDIEATNIILNPGLAFGTGDHPTTKLCLLLLHTVIKGGETFLDYGTGSGILAIAALKLGAAFSAGLDKEPQAITAATHNANLNSITPEKLSLSLVPSGRSSTFIAEISQKDTNRQHMYDNKGFLSETEKFDVVIANILLNPLLDLADNIVSFAKPGAVVGLSGIISEQVPRIIERYSPFLENLTVSNMDDWACITGTKK